MPRVGRRLHHQFDRLQVTFREPQPCDEPEPYLEFGFKGSKMILDERAQWQKQEADERLNNIMGNTPFGKVHESGSWLGITGGSIGCVLQKSHSEPRRCIS